MDFQNFYDSGYQICIFLFNKIYEHRCIIYCLVCLNLLILFISIIILGYIFFSEIPSINTIIGAVIISLSGLFVIQRQKKLGKIN